MIVPLGDLMRQLVLALGGALLLSAIAVLIKESRQSRRRDQTDQSLRLSNNSVSPRPNYKVVIVNLVVGTILTVWGLASVIASR